MDFSTTASNPIHLTTRGYGEGALDSVGYNGYSWSSTVSGTNGMGLDFGVTWLHPSHAGNRAFGVPLRCLSE